MVGASTDRIWRWKNASHEHNAIVRQGTHICQVTVLSAPPGAAAALIPEVDINSPCVTATASDDITNYCTESSLARHAGSMQPGMSISNRLHSEYELRRKLENSGAASAADTGACAGGGLVACDL